MISLELCDIQNQQGMSTINVKIKGQPPINILSYADIIY